MKVHNSILHVLSAVTLIVFIVLAYGSAEEQDTPEYKAAQKKLEKEGIISTEAEIDQQKKYKGLIIGKWCLDSVVGGSYGTAYFQRNYKSVNDNVIITEFKNDGTYTTTTTNHYHKNNSPGGKQTSSYGYYIQHNGIYSLMRHGINNEQLSHIFLPIILLDSVRLIHTLNNNGNEEKHYYTRIK